MSTHKRSRKDYMDPRFIEAPQKAAEILVKHKNEWHSIIDAYWILRKYEDDIGIPVTYDIVERAYSIAIKKLRIEYKRRQIDIYQYDVSSTMSSGKLSTSNI